MQRHHRIIESDEGRYLRRVLNDPNIATLLHLIHGSIMIIRWVKKDAFVFAEVGTIPANYNNKARHQEMNRIINMNSPASLRVVKEIIEKARRADRDHLSEAQEQADKHLEFKEFLRKRAHVSVQDHPMWSVL